MNTDRTVDSNTAVRIATAVTDKPYLERTSTSC